MSLRMAVALVLLLIAAACSDGGSAVGRAAAGGAAADDRPLVITTVAPITSLVSSVVGDRARVVGLVPEATDSHTFEPSPSTAELLATADVVFLNGLWLEEPTKALAIANMAPGVPLVELGNRTIGTDEYQFDSSFPEQAGRPNPHLWTDPGLVLEYVDIVAETMVEIDPANGTAYRGWAEEFSDQVQAFERTVATALNTVPVEHRRLVTYHDAYAYFADRYGWEVVGAIQPADFGDPTPREVVALIDQIREESVPAIFGSAVFPSAVLEQVAAETGASYIDDLRDDDLPGSPGDPQHSWLGLMQFNVATLVRALGGDPADVERFDITSVSSDRAVYPQ